MAYLRLPANPAMLSLFKKIFTKGATQQPSAGRTAPAAATVREIKPFAPPSRNAPPAPKETAPPIPSGAPNPSAVPNAAAAAASSGADSLRLSLTAIVGLFPKDIPGPANPAMID